MRNTLILAAAAAAMSVGGCATMGPSTAGATTPQDARTYAQMAAASDMFEINSSRLALTRTQDQAVREFAQMMIDHHTRTTQQLTAAAQASGVAVSPQLMPMQAEMMSQLQQAQGADFDRLYKSQQLQAHQMAVTLHANYARDGDNPALRTVAAAATPIVTQHLAQIRTMQN